MLKDVTLLVIGAVFGLGAALAAMAAPLYYPTAPRWIWHYAFWLGIAMFVLMALDTGAILLLQSKLRTGTVAYATIGAFLIALAVVHQSSPRVSFLEPKVFWKHTLHDLYKMDFPNTSKLETNTLIATHGAYDKNSIINIDVEMNICQDFDAGSDFIEVFIPESHNINIDDRIFDCIAWLSDNIPRLYEKLKNSVVVGTSAPGSSYFTSKDLKFSGKVYIYTMQQFDAIQIGQLTQTFRDKGMNLEIRGQDYWSSNKDR